MWAPCGPREPCYLGSVNETTLNTLSNTSHQPSLTEQRNKTTTQKICTYYAIYWRQIVFANNMFQNIAVTGANFGLKCQGALPGTTQYFWSCVCRHSIFHSYDVSLKNVKIPNTILMRFLRHSNIVLICVGTIEAVITRPIFQNIYTRDPIKRYCTAAVIHHWYM